jgi:hypothetical protein
MKKTRTVPHRRPRLHELKHKGMTRFIRVLNKPCTWIEVDDTETDDDARNRYLARLAFNNA